MRRLLAGLVLVCGNAHAGLIADQHREDLIQQILGVFWGKAKLPGGQFVQPASDLERTTVPISKTAAYRVIDAGEISGLGEWCRLDWERHYLALTRAARASGFSDKQVAFVSVLHGAAQGVVASGRAKGPQCDAADRGRIAEMLEQSTGKGVDGN